MTKNLVKFPRYLTSSEKFSIVPDKVDCWIDPEYVMFFYDGFIPDSTVKCVVLVIEGSFVIYTSDPLQTVKDKVLGVL